MVVLVVMMILMLISNVHGLATPAGASKGGSSSSSSSSSQQTKQSPLTWQELGLQLLQLKKQGMPDHALLSSRLILPNLDRTRVDESELPNAGRGLFATQDAVPGDLLTCYPGDILLQMTFESEGSVRLKPIVENTGQNDNESRANDWPKLIPYILQVTDNFCLLGLPERDDDPAYLGHFANDAAKPTTLMTMDLDQYEQISNEVCTVLLHLLVVFSAPMIYALISHMNIFILFLLFYFSLCLSPSKKNIQRCNAMHQPLENLHMVVIATTHIKKGEEILVSYGSEYWQCLASANQNNQNIINNDDNARP